MSGKKTRASLIERRGELLAELFLEELQPLFLARSTRDLDYDLLLGLRNSKGGINHIGVEVKTTKRLSQMRYPLPQSLFERLRNSNFPVLLLVVNAKENRLYFALLDALPELSEYGLLASEFTPVQVELTEINDETKKALMDRLVA
jgi:hypothetical protein